MPNHQFKVGQTVVLARVKHTQFRGMVGTVARVSKTRGTVLVHLSETLSYNADPSNLDPKAEPQSVENQ